MQQIAYILIKKDGVKNCSIGFVISVRGSKENTTELILPHFHTHEVLLLRIVVLKFLLEK